LVDIDTKNRLNLKQAIIVQCMKIGANNTIFPKQYEILKQTVAVNI